MEKKKLFLCWGGVISFLMLPMMAWADSISPSSYATTLGVGGSVTIEKTVTITPAATGKADVYFLADTTGSMGGTINAVKASASDILASIAGLGDVNFAVGEYKDFGEAGTYTLNQGVTSSAASAQAGINAWFASGGADWPEAQLNALTQASSATTGWRDGSTRILVWFGDAPGHDPSGGATLASTETALNAAHIDVLAVNVGDMNNASYGSQASNIATATGGVYYDGISSSSIVDTITAAIESAINTYSTVGLAVVGDPGGVDVEISSGYAGAYDRTVERTFTFDVTFTGAVPGTYSFDIAALVDGGTVALEGDRITVGGDAVPEPTTMLLLGIGLVGLGALKRKMR